MGNLLFVGRVWRAVDGCVCGSGAMGGLVSGLVSGLVGAFASLADCIYENITCSERLSFHHARV